MLIDNWELSIFSKILWTWFIYFAWKKPVFRDISYPSYSVQMRDKVDQNISEYGHFWYYYLFGEKLDEKLVKVMNANQR